MGMMWCWCTKSTQASVRPPWRCVHAGHVPSWGGWVATLVSPTMCKYLLFIKKSHKLHDKDLLSLPPPPKHRQARKMSLFLLVTLQLGWVSFPGHEVCYRPAVRPWVSHFTSWHLSLLLQKCSASSEFQSRAGTGVRQARGSEGHDSPIPPF